MTPSTMFEDSSASRRIMELEKALETARREASRLRGLLGLDRRLLEAALDAARARSADELQRIAERSYAFAFFVLGDEERAFRATCSALARVQGATEKDERRREYWWRRSTGRRPKRAFLDTPQLCQWLLLLETAEEERKQEGRLAALSPEDLLIRIIKQLVEASFELGSWHLNAALTLLLRGLPPKSACRLQKLLDTGETSFRPEVYASDPMKRRLGEAKHFIAARFGDRFAARWPDSPPPWRALTAEERERWQPLAERTLARLVPWEIADPWPDADAIEPASFESLLSPKSSPGTVGRAELIRKRALTDPESYRRLAALLDLPQPHSRWHVPAFFPSTDDSPPGGPPPLGGHRPPDGLDGGRLLALVQRLARVSEIRAQLPDVLTISVDGVVQRRWHHRRGRRLSLETSAFARRIELLAEEDAGALPVATFWVQRVPGGGTSRRTVGRRCFRLRRAAAGERGDGQTFELGVERVFPGWRRTFSTPALRRLAATLAMLALVGLGFWIGQGSQRPPVAAGVAFQHLQLADPAIRGEGERQRIHLSPRAKSLVLVVAVPSGLVDAAFDLELETEDRSWSWAGLRPIDGELSLALPAGALRGGPNHLRLRAREGPDDAWRATALFEIIEDDD